MKLEINHEKKWEKCASRLNNMILRKQWIDYEIEKRNLKLPWDKDSKIQLYKIDKMHTWPLHSTPQSGKQTAQPLATPLLIPHKEQYYSPLGNEQGTLYFLSFLQPVQESNKAVWRKKFLFFSSHKFHLLKQKHFLEKLLAVIQAFQKEIRKISKVNITYHLKESDKEQQSQPEGWKNKDQRGNK